MNKHILFFILIIVLIIIYNFINIKENFEEIINNKTNQINYPTTILSDNIKTETDKNDGTFGFSLIFFFMSFMIFILLILYNLNSSKNNNQQNYSLPQSELFKKYNTTYQSVPQQLQLPMQMSLQTPMQMSLQMPLQMSLQTPMQLSSQIFNQQIPKIM